MKRTMMGLVAMLTLGAGTLSSRHAAADTASNSRDSGSAALAIGFHNPLAPIGARFWLMGQRVGLDVGGGYKVGEQNLNDGRLATLTAFTLDVGLPITIRRWEKLRFIGRPGFMYQSQDIEVLHEDVDTNLPLPSDIVRYTVLSLRAEVEAEYFLVDRLSASAGYGAQFSRDSGSIKSSESLGGNLFELGFHLYVWSGE